MKKQNSTKKNTNEKNNQTNGGFSITDLLNSEQDDLNRQQMKHNNE